MQRYSKVVKIKEIEEMQKSMERLFRDFCANVNTVLMVSQGVWQPKTDVYETKDAIVIKMEVAGLRHEDFSVSVNEDTLAIRGRRIDHSNHEKLSYRQMEIEYDHFERIIIIPVPIDAERISAEYKDGFLTVKLPKVTVSERRVVPIEGEEE